MLQLHHFKNKVLFMKILSSSIGIIGGADGPTAIFVSTADDFWVYVEIATAVIVAVVATILIIKKRRKK